MRALVIVLAAVSRPALAQPTFTPEQPPFDTRLVERGKVWWCDTGDEPRACFRDADDCKKDNGGKACAQTAKVFAFTQGAHAGDPDTPAYAFTTAAACAQDVDRHLRQVPPPSDCQAVGATTLPPITAADAPGTGWFCFDHPREGFADCARTKADCTAQRAKASGSGLGECIARTTPAWAFRTGHAVLARSTRAACDALRPKAAKRLLATDCAQLP